MTKLYQIRKKKESLILKSRQSNPKLCQKGNTYLPLFYHIGSFDLWIAEFDDNISKWHEIKERSDRPLMVAGFPGT